MGLLKKLFGSSEKESKKLKFNKLDIESLLSSDDTNNAIIEIDTFVCELCSYGDEMNKLTDEQKQFFYNQNLEREINNGGFDQYFSNSSGDFAHETIISLILINANHTANILQNAIDQFPEKIVPKNRNERQETMDKIEEKSGSIWEELDQKFFEYQDNLHDLNLEYIKKYQDKF